MVLESGKMKYLFAAVVIVSRSKCLFVFYKQSCSENILESTRQGLLFNSKVATTIKRTVESSPSNLSNFLELVLNTSGLTAISIQSHWIQKW